MPRPRPPIFEEYRHEYDSGVGFFPSTSCGIEVDLTNRGATAEFARVIIYGQDGITNEAPIIKYGQQEWLDSGKEILYPGVLCSVTFQPWYFEVEPPKNFILGWCWARILTSSLNLVPSMRIFRHWQDRSDDQWFGPGDFAVFDVSIPERPPIGPVKP
jgi:hypothetical protein